MGADNGGFDRPPARSRWGGRSWGAVVCLCAAVALAAGCLRSQTADVSEPDIGGGMLFIAGPVLVAALFVAACLLSQMGTRRRAVKIIVTVLATLTGPGLFGLLAVVSSEHQANGVISRDQYAQVRIGETRSTLHHALGGPTSAAEQFFAPIAAGLRCEYYTESKAGSDPTALQFQFCFRGEVIVGKERSNHIYDA
jgi:hypothetical protein